MLDYKLPVRQLNEIDQSRRTVFAASCCERLLPDYEVFSQMAHWGDPNLLREALDNVWRSLGENQPGRDWTRRWERDCARFVPDTEDFRVPFATNAIYASAAVVCALRCCRDESACTAIEVSRAAYSSVRCYVAVAMDPQTEVHEQDLEFESWVERAPLLLAEVQKQQHDVDLLLGAGGVDAETVEWIRRSSARMGVRPRQRWQIQVPDRILTITIDKPWLRTRLAAGRGRKEDEIRRVLRDALTSASAGRVEHYRMQNRSEGIDVALPMEADIDAAIQIIRQVLKDQRAPSGSLILRREYRTIIEPVYPGQSK